MANALTQRAGRIRLLTCDVDGVLTDGCIYMDDAGNEFKAFAALDGVGFNLLAHGGITVGWITGSAAPAVAQRARQLDIAHVIQDSGDKLLAWEKLRIALGVEPSACAHIGDDLPDLPVLEACGLAVTVPHAPRPLRACAHYITLREGGRGAVRELAELILEARGRLSVLTAHGIVGARA